MKPNFPFYRRFIAQTIVVFLLSIIASQSHAAMYKYLTKDGETILSGEKLKGPKLIKVFQIKKSGAYKSSESNKVKTASTKKSSKKSNKKKSKKKSLGNIASANGRDNGVIYGCSNKQHLNKQANLYKNTIQIYSRIYDVDEELVYAIVRQESCFNEGALSRVGAIGLMQLMPQTALGLRINDPWNPEHNIQGGIKYISEMLRLFNGNYKLAIAAYNAGPGNVKKHKGIPPFKETRNYVVKVYDEYQRLKKSGITYGDKKVQIASQ